MRRRGFTLAEMLVVIGIIIVLVGLLSPMIVRAWKAGDRARTVADLNAIGLALEAYRQDHGDYPRVAGKPYDTAADLKYNGARLLCRALLGPGPKDVAKPEDVADGADGPGFRTRGTQGQVYGPYLRPETFKVGDPSSPTTKEPPRGLLALLDSYGSPILYYPATGRPNIGTAYVGDYDPDLPPTGAVRPLYNAHDNNGAIPAVKLKQLLGDANRNGGIDKPSEVEAYTGPFILWSAGPDTVFGPAGAVVTLAKSDDITNFRN